MDPLRRLKQFGLLIVLACILGAVWILIRKAIGGFTLGWPTTIIIVIGLLAVSVAIVYAISRSSYLPTPGQVQIVVEEIQAAHARGISSYKGQLHFFFPPHWRTYKVGKEGWVLRTKGLGIPVAFSLWATDKDIMFNDDSFEGMVRNVQDLAHREGAHIDRGSVIPRQIAGVDGIEYLIVDSKGHQMQAFFWCYGDGDYQLLIDTSSPEHLRLIRPAVDAFLRYCYMKVEESEYTTKLGPELLKMEGESPEGGLLRKAREYQQHVQPLQPTGSRPLRYVTTDIVRSIQDGDTVIFCGAGISVNSGLPSARPFMDAVLRELNASEDEIELMRKEPIPFESFMGILQESCSIDLLLDIFGEGEPNVNHMLMANLMDAGKVDLVVTTNFDLLFEGALLRKGWIEGKPYDIYYREKDFPGINWQNRRPKLIKIHGSIHDREEMAITMQQIAGKRYSEPRQVVIDQIFGAGNHRQVLILGYSSSDSFDLSPYIQAIKNRHKKVIIVEHQAESTDTVQIEDIRSRPSNNPFKQYLGSLRIYCNTDHLVRQIWRATLGTPPDSMPATGGDLWRQNLHQWYLEMLERHSNAAENLIIGRILLDINKYAAAARRFQRAVSLSQTAGEKKQEAFALALLGAVTNSIPRLEKALAISQEIDDKKQEADCLCTLAPLYYLNSTKIRKAVQCCEDGLVIARSTGDKQHEGRLLGNLGSIYGSRQQFRKAIEYFEGALRASCETGDKAEEGRSLFNIGLAFENMGKLEKAKEYYERASQTLGPFLGATHPVAKKVEDKLAGLRGG